MPRHTHVRLQGGGGGKRGGHRTCGCVQSNVVMLQYTLPSLPVDAIWGNTNQRRRSVHNEAGRTSQRNLSTTGTIEKEERGHSRPRSSREVHVHSEMISPASSRR